MSAKIKARRRNLFTLSCLFLACSAQDVSAQTLKNELGRILVEHQLMKTVTNDVSAAKEDVSTEKSAWLQRVTVRATAGAHAITRDVGVNGSYNPTETSIGLNQLLWDFGTTNNNISRAQKNLFKEEQEFATQRINLVLAGIEAHLKLLRAIEVYEFAVQSEENIKKQTAMESSRIDLGKGYTTDLLQAKVQLSGAKARRIGALSALDNATNRYRAVFGQDYIKQGVLEGVKDPTDELPKSLKEVLDLSENTNPDVLAARARVALAQAARDATFSKEWMPRMDVQLDESHKREADGVDGPRRDTKALVQFNWSFDTGLKALHATDALSFQAASEMEKTSYVVVQAQEEARNAWTDWLTARERQEILHDQAAITQKFLLLARKEREQGRRSLIDVLSGETSLINAQSDAASADIDSVLAAFRVLRATGLLDIEQVHPDASKRVTIPTIDPARLSTVALKKRDIPVVQNTALAPEPDPALPRIEQLGDGWQLSFPRFGTKLQARAEADGSILFKGKRFDYLAKPQDAGEFLLSELTKNSDEPTGWERVVVKPAHVSATSSVQEAR